jgi:hypothetical protein
MFASTPAHRASSTPRPIARYTGAALALLLAAGCASYPKRTAQALRDFQRGHFAQSMQAYGDIEKVGSAFLSGAEAGMVALTAGNWEAALAHLHLAAEAVEDIEGRALVGKERLGEALLSWGINDTAKSYQGEGFERVYVHCGLAMAYLAQGLLDDVWVEVQLANSLLEAEEELYEKKYAAGGLGHFISAVAYEILGELDHAYIDYKRMEEKGVGTELAGRALVRLANVLGWDDERGTWEERYGADVARPPGAASVVVIGGLGLGPFKFEGSLLVPTEDGLIPMAVPQYQARPQQVSALRISVAGSGEGVQTAMIEHVSSVAMENLEDRMLWSATKSLARGILKREVTKKLEDEFDLAGRIAGDLFAAFSERADLRCWQTLPDSWHGCRMFLSPGVHSFELEALGGQRRDLGTYELEPGETLVVLARSVGPHLYAHAIGGSLIREPETTTTGEALVAP